MGKLEQHIEKWSKSKGANVSLDSFRYEFEQFKEIVGKQKFPRVLEIGSGSGLFLTYLLVSSHSDQCVGIDPVYEKDGTKKNEVHKTREIIEEMNIKNKIDLRFQTFQGFLKSGEDKYDLIIFRDSLHHIYPKEGKDSKKESIRNLSRVKSFLKDNGHIYILEESRPHFLYRLGHDLHRLLRGNDKMDWKDKRTKGEWKNILKEAGFQEISIETVPVNLFSLYKKSPKLGKLISTSFLITDSKE